MLAIIDCNKFNYKNKIGEFTYIDIKDLVNNIKNNTISEYLLKRFKYIKRNKKNTEIIKKRTYTSKQKQLVNLFNDLDTILIDKTLESKSQNDKTLIS